ncbi:hypothetical protein fugu_019997 [Takifugu bimaculatus]|uniref:Uncharacterized protein n=1 Tax=Takifugu bimaculatus TaxID=433685 RepID=A0A4Z2BIN9_9TELE|nr:hypothetical protein fugu_019997 [Takifugu bimaculatus]
MSKESSEEGIQPGLPQKKVLESDDVGRSPAVCAKQALVVMVTEEVDRERRLLNFGDDRSHSWRSGHPLDHVQGRGGTDLKGQPEVFESGITHLIHHIFSFRHSCPSSSDHRVPSEPAGLLVVRLMSKG